MCEPQSEGPEEFKTEAASSLEFGSKSPDSVTGVPEGLKEEAHLLASRTALSWDFPGGPVVKICIPVQGTWVQSLVRELRFHVANKQKRMVHSSLIENLLTGPRA